MTFEESAKAWTDWLVDQNKDVSFVEAFMAPVPPAHREKLSEFLCAKLRDCGAMA